MNLVRLYGELSRLEMGAKALVAVLVRQQHSRLAQASLIAWRTEI